MRMNQIGLLLNSALYLTGVFVAGIFFNVQMAWVLAIVTFGAAFVCYQAQEARDEAPEGALRGFITKIALVSWAASLVSGVAAGLSLLF